MALVIEPGVLVSWNQLDAQTRAELQAHLERIAASPRAGAGVLATQGLTVAFRIDRSVPSLVVTHLHRDREPTSRAGAP